MIVPFYWLILRREWPLWFRQSVGQEQISLTGYRQLMRGVSSWQILWKLSEFNSFCVSLCVGSPRSRFWCIEQNCWNQTEKKLLLAILSGCLFNWEQCFINHSDNRWQSCQESPVWVGEIVRVGLTFRPFIWFRSGDLVNHPETFVHWCRLLSGSVGRFKLLSGHLSTEAAQNVPHYSDSAPRWCQWLCCCRKWASRFLSLLQPSFN